MPELRSTAEIIVELKEAISDCDAVLADRERETEYYAEWRCAIKEKYERNSRIMREEHAEAVSRWDDALRDKSRLECELNAILNSTAEEHEQPHE